MKKIKEREGIRTEENIKKFRRKGKEDRLKKSNLEEKKTKRNVAKTINGGIKERKKKNERGLE